MSTINEETSSEKDKGGHSSTDFTEDFVNEQDDLDN